MVTQLSVCHADAYLCNRLSAIGRHEFVSHRRTKNIKKDLDIFLQLLKIEPPASCNNL